MLYSIKCDSIIQFTVCEIHKKLEIINAMRRKKIPTIRYETFLLISISAIFIGADRQVSARNEVPEEPARQLRGTQGPGYPDTLAQNSPGTIEIFVTDISGKTLRSDMVLYDSGATLSREVSLPNGQAVIEQAPGNYSAHTFVYDSDVPILIDIREVVVRSGITTEISIELLEGRSGNRGIRAFDQDFDLVLDRVELEAGTDPADARSIPGVKSFDWPSPVLDEAGAWYRGELHSHSTYGRGDETVAELVKRAEKLRLDFLAITDRNTLAAAFDPAFRSESMVMIPAMEWGDDERGQALLYAPATFPEYTESYAEAQAMVIRVQAQGGIFAIAHPNFPIGSWQWGLQYANAVEAWCRGWRMIPPMHMGQLDERWRRRQDGKLIHSIAVAAATRGFSANSQSTLFWDLELVRGMKSGVIAGSSSATPKVPLASPVTYVYGREKSLRGILEGLRKGRTFVSSGLDGPTIEFQADILDDGSIDAGVGSIIPINRTSRLIVRIRNAKGARMDILRNGLPIRSRPIKSNEDFFSMREKPETLAVYRVRIVETATEFGFGPTQLLAMSSPIYAQSYLVDDSATGVEGWIELENQYANPREWEGRLPVDAERYELKLLTPSRP